jgi:hypothetical protein
LLLPPLPILLFAGIAFCRSLFAAQGRLNGLCLRVAMLNFAAALLSSLTAAGMFVARLLFPNVNTFEGDQSYGVALVYWGLLVLATLYLFFLYLARSAPKMLSSRSVINPNEA